MGLSFFLDMGSLISRTTFEKQGIALLENGVHGPTRLYYLVNVNFVAWMHIGGTNTTEATSPMNNQLTKRQKRYERNVLAGLNHTSVLDPPSFLLFQALLTGVRILSFSLFFFY